MLKFKAEILYIYFRQIVGDGQIFLTILYVCMRDEYKKEFWSYRTKFARVLIFETRELG